MSFGHYISKKVEHRYQRNTPFERLAIYDVDICLKSGHYYAVIGHTGSGKSTFIQHLNGLLQPTNGEVRVGEQVISSHKKEKKSLNRFAKKGRCCVSISRTSTFFEETVEKDICFGPVNFWCNRRTSKEKKQEM
ncbi:hypothetical protein GCM10020331_017270 [Ectobacillus funiculus]